MAVYEKGRASHEKEFTQDEKRFSRAEKSSQQSRGGAGLRRGEEVRAKKLRSKLSICAYTWGQNHIPSGQAELPVHLYEYSTGHARVLAQPFKPSRQPSTHFEHTSTTHQHPHSPHIQHTSNTHTPYAKMATNDFTPREDEIMAAAWRCFEGGEPKVDFKKLAPLVGMGNPGSAKNAWAKIKKKLAAGTNDFTVRELQIMACAWRSFEGEPKVDFKKLAPLVDMGNPGSAKNAWAKIKKKLAARALEVAGDTEAMTTTTSTPKPKATPKKRARSELKKEDTGSDDGDESPVKKVKATPKKGRGKKAVGELVGSDDEKVDERVDEVVGVEEVPVKAGAVDADHSVDTGDLL
ncbi:unnamed protein product [Zymoseptoria tritici ST99CH_3D1]|nr:unnamed protein product [Zymoseptoria tritici ST99CH_3D1]